MGLDIRVNVTVAQMRKNLSKLDNGIQQSEALRIMLNMDDDKTIVTQPGSYRGLHVVREVYAEMREWPEYSTALPFNEAHSSSHLMNHSDCDGWYLPERFDLPQWIPRSEGKDSISVGSSYKLLEELTSMLAAKDKWPESLHWRWDAVFIAAVASVVCHCPIEFS